MPTPRKSFRHPTDEWRKAVAIAHIRGETVPGAVLSPAVRRYVKRYEHLLAERADGGR